MKIEVGFSTPHRFVFTSWLIRAIEGTDFSHTFIQFFENGQRIVVHSTHHRVNFVSWDIFCDKNLPLRMVQLHVSNDDFQEFKRFIYCNAGKEYGYKLAFGFLLQRFLRIFGIKRRPFFADGDKSYVCSELTIKILQDIFNLKLGLDSEKDGPKELYESIKGMK